MGANAGVTRTKTDSGTARVGSSGQKTDTIFTLPLKSENRLRGRRKRRAGGALLCAQTGISAAANAPATGDIGHASEAEGTDDAVL